LEVRCAHAGKITVASAGIGSAPHMFWELFRSLSGVDMLHVPYRGGGPALVTLLGGQVQTYFGTSHHRSNTSGREPRDQCRAGPDARVTLRIAELGDIPLSLPVSEFAKLIVDETGKWRHSHSKDQGGIGNRNRPAYCLVTPLRAV
jgi:hypothetical protein